MNGGLRPKSSELWQVAQALDLSAVTVTGKTPTFGLIDLVMWLSAHIYLKIFLSLLQNSKYKVLNRDQWCNVLEFSRSILPDLSNYDEDGACKFHIFWIFVVVKSNIIARQSQSQGTCGSWETWRVLEFYLNILQT